MAMCSRCGGFAGNEYWRKYCRDCFVAIKREEERDREQTIADLQSLLMDAQRKLQQVQRCPFTPDELKWLIQITHPDKNGNSEVATSVTGKLLAMRR